MAHASGTRGMQKFGAFLPRRLGEWACRSFSSLQCIPGAALGPRDLQPVCAGAALQPIRPDSSTPATGYSRRGNARQCQWRKGEELAG